MIDVMGYLWYNSLTVDINKQKKIGVNNVLRIYSRIKKW